MLLMTYQVFKDSVVGRLIENGGRIHPVLFRRAAFLARSAIQGHKGAFPSLPSSLRHQLKGTSLLARAQFGLQSEIFLPFATDFRNLCYDYKLEPVKRLSQILYP